MEIASSADEHDSFRFRKLLICPIIMRVKEQTQSGFFWLPLKPEKQYPGTLKIYDGGKIVLELYGVFDNSLELEFMKQSGNHNVFPLGQVIKIPRIIGLIDSCYVTLDDCSSFHLGFSIPGTSKSRVQAKTAFMGGGGLTIKMSKSKLIKCDFL